MSTSKVVGYRSLYPRKGGLFGSSVGRRALQMDKSEARRTMAAYLVGAFEGAERELLHRLVVDLDNRP